MSIPTSDTRIAVAFVRDSQRTQLIPDDQAIADRVVHLAEADGYQLQVTDASWDDSTVDWTQYHAVIIRETWDYHTRVIEFKTWLETLQTSGVPLYNHPTTVQWNLDKRYLRQLRDQCGVPIIPTLFLEPKSASITTLPGEPPAPATTAISKLDTDDRKAVEAFITKFGQETIYVIKPCVSADSLHTYSCSSAEVLDTIEKTLPQLAQPNALMLQPFVDSIKSTGERSMVYINNTFAYGLAKHPAEGDWRVQEAYGGQTVAAEASADEVAFGNMVMKAVVDVVAPLAHGVRFPWQPPLYTRVDCLTAGGNVNLPPVMLGEVELIEPSLYSLEGRGTEQVAKGFYSVILANRKA